MKLKHLGICGIVSLLSYTAMVVFNAVLGVFLLKGAFPTEYAGEGGQSNE